MEPIESLVNQELFKIGRASNMVWLLFGRSISETGRLKNEAERGEYALHFQCPLRIVDKSTSEILLASSDIYVPRSSWKETEFFSWETIGSSMFDEKVEMLFHRLKNCIVRDVSITEHNDLVLHFSCGLILECFIDISYKQECWRFLEYGRQHYVVGCNMRETQ